MIQEKHCLQCGHAMQGRADKKFCDDQCRSIYNRDQKMAGTAYVKNVNAVLAKNRHILLEMNPAGKAKVLYKDMKALGFDFSYFTSILKTGDRSYYYFCYEMGYLVINRETVLLVKRENHQRMEALR
ncbi:DUF2116 family Zn-ribbon domain-containing protein [Pedobacter africanus]|uniref:Uncharacterized protein containing a Zn-ribbon n=1 Tax=Pedobacter africanus TaxID=151894 RepID=A0A1W2CTK2_9SPHI|nr:DUF2116 family Zn-ribbon domain-containing protein [Pedobacter africanus]SMC88559.1 Uncharacterized protein containing a Zn-ribbon [Pedobacter africanus]